MVKTEPMVIVTTEPTVQLAIRSDGLVDTHVSDNDVEDGLITAGKVELEDPVCLEGVDGLAVDLVVMEVRMTPVATFILISSSFVQHAHRLRFDSGRRIWRRKFSDGRHTQDFREEIFSLIRRYTQD